MNCKCVVLWLAVAILQSARGAAAQSPAPAATEPAPPVAAQTAPKVVEEGAFPTSIKIPGTDVSLAIGGYIKVDFIQDFSAIGDTNEFKVSTIPVQGSAAAAQSGQTTIHARETRLHLEVRSDGGGHQFRAFAEGDFFGDKNAFRMRHAYGEFGAVLGGQTWSTFQDITARPLTVDFEGPDGEVFLRTPMIRVSLAIAPNWKLAVAVENPAPQFSVPSDLSGAPRSTMPDIPAHVRYEHGKGHFQMAGMVRQLRFDSNAEDADVSVMGWGVNTTGAIAIGRDQLQVQYAIGDGTARYIEALSGQNLDALLSSPRTLRTLRSQAAAVGYTHVWRAGLRSGYSYSTAGVEDDAALSGTTIDRTQDVRVNLFWTPYRLVDFAGELLWGERANKNGSNGEAWRFQFAAIYRLR